MAKPHTCLNAVSQAMMPEPRHLQLLKEVVLSSGLLTDPAGVAREEYIKYREEFGLVIPDAVYGQVQLGLLASLLAKTPELMRLQKLKQLGLCFKKFPGACHSRYEHSVGVAHLAGLFGLHLLGQAGECIGMTVLDVELLEVAGLCHDLGHGPFSHVFEHCVLPTLGIKGWKHENMSKVLLNRMLRRLLKGLCQEQQQQSLRQGWGCEQQLKLPAAEQLLDPICDLIEGKPSSGHSWSGKTFMLQIVASHLDVDRLDYLARDVLYTHGRLSHNGWLRDYRPLIYNSRLIGGVICFAESDVTLLQSVFQTRFYMHQFVYQHPEVKGMEMMVADAIKAAPAVIPADLADETASVEAKADSFLPLTDSLTCEIKRRATEATQLQPAATVLDRIDNGNSYFCVTEVQLEAEEEPAQQVCITADHVITALCSSSSSLGLTADDIRISTVRIDHCARDKDPMQQLWLWRECGGGVLKEQGCWLGDRPSSFIARWVRVYLARDCSRAAEEWLCSCKTQLEAALQRVVQQQLKLAEQASRSSIPSVAASGAAAQLAGQEGVMADAATSRSMNVEAEEEEEEEEEEELLATQVFVQETAGPTAYVNAAAAAAMPRGCGKQEGSQLPDSSQQLILTQLPAPGTASPAAAASAPALPTGFDLCELDSQLPDFLQQQDGVALSLRTPAATAGDRCWTDPLSSQVEESSQQPLSWSSQVSTQPGSGFSGLGGSQREEAVPFGAFMAVQQQEQQPQQQHREMAGSTNAAKRSHQRMEGSMAAGMPAAAMAATPKKQRGEAVAAAAAADQQHGEAVAEEQVDISTVDLKEQQRLWEEAKRRNERRKMLLQEQAEVRSRASAATRTSRSQHGRARR